jgi:serine/threonine protein phosphatase PrpC
MTPEVWPHVLIGALALLLVILFVLRERTAKTVATQIDLGSGQTIGKRELQADVCSVASSKTGYMAVVADGMGAERFGVKISQIACEAVEERFSCYEDHMNTALFFKNAMTVADKRIKNYLGGERGGVSLTIAVIMGNRLYYSYCGNTRLAVWRRGSLISLYAGNTMREFAEKAYLSGKLKREDAVRRLNDKRVYRYLGMEDFRPEKEETPIRLESGDRIILMTDGVFESVGRTELAGILAEKGSAQVLAEKVIAACEKAVCEDNASVVIAKV